MNKLRLPRIPPQTTTSWRAKNKDIILRQGDGVHIIRFLEHGLCRLFFVDADGNEHTKYFLGPGYFVVPIHALFSDVESWFSIQAVTDCDGWQMPAAAFKKLISKDLSWGNYWSLYMVQLFIEKEDRERDFLTLDARERYEKLIHNAPDLFNEVPLHQIASFLGVTDVTLSRIRSSSRNNAK